MLEQDYPQVEYMIVDGGSTDGSLEIIRRYEDRVAWWISEPDTGQTEAINKGFARATGEILAWLNSDDVYYPRAVSEAVTYLEAHTEVGMVYGDTDYIDESGKVIGKFPRRRPTSGVCAAAMYTSRSRRLSSGPSSGRWLVRWTLLSISPWTTISGCGSLLGGMIRVHRRSGGGRLSVIYFN